MLRTPENNGRTDRQLGAGFELLHFRGEPSQTHERYRHLLGALGVAGTEINRSADVRDSGLAARTVRAEHDFVFPPQEGVWLLPTAGHGDRPTRSTDFRRLEARAYIPAHMQGEVVVDYRNFGWGNPPLLFVGVRAVEGLFAPLQDLVVAAFEQPLPPPPLPLIANLEQAPH